MKIPKEITTPQLLKVWLKQNGFDGIFAEPADCACENTELVPCGEDFSLCEPGYKVPCDCGDHHFHIDKRRAEQR